MRQIILDCDPGHDDAIAMIMAASSLAPLDILAVTTVHGNIGIDNTTLNARRIADIIGLQAPLAQGATRPLVKAPIIAEEIHGESGLDGPHLPDQAETTLDDRFGPDLIIDTVRQAEGPVTLVATGPLTNVALALLKAPDIKDKIDEISIMGGGTYGNWTPAAEFNIYVDPEAARIVFESGLPIAQFGLDVTHQTKATPDRIDHLAQIDTPVAEFVVDLLKEFSKNYKAYYGFEGAPIHDACAVAYLMDPSLFEMKKVHVAVETQGEFTTGMTVVDRFDKSGQEAQVNFAYGVDTDGLYDLLAEVLKSYAVDS